MYLWRDQALIIQSNPLSLYLDLFLWFRCNRFRNALHIPLDFCEDLIEVLHFLIFHGIDLWSHTNYTGAGATKRRRTYGGRFQIHVRERREGGKKKEIKVEGEILRVWALSWQALLCSYSSSACLPLERRFSVFSLFAYSLPCCYLGREHKSAWERFHFSTIACGVFFFLFAVCIHLLSKWSHMFEALLINTHVEIVHGPPLSPPTLSRRLISCYDDTSLRQTVSHETWTGPWLSYNVAIKCYVIEVILNAVQIEILFQRESEPSQNFMHNSV